MPNNEYAMRVADVSYPGKKYHGGYVYLHIYEFWKKTERLPFQNHVVHHLNGNKHDNRWENLEEISKSAHALGHHIAPPIKHGKRSGYKRGCRCKDCVTVNSDYLRKYYARRRDGRVVNSSGL